MNPSSSSESLPIVPTTKELHSRSLGRYVNLAQHGWRVRVRHRFGYHKPDEYYEAIVDRLVIDGCSWLDVGGGKSVFPDNPELARALVRRCRYLVAVDPSDNVEANLFVHARARCAIEEYRSDRSFDLATLRMVAEHIPDAPRAVASLARLVRPGGHVVIYTPHRWSAASVLARLIPNRMHSPITKLLWHREDEDVFPTHYKMNTRRHLKTLFEENGFREAAFLYLDACSVLERFRLSFLLELAMWRVLRTIGLHLVEINLLGVYSKR